MERNSRGDAKPAMFGNGKPITIQIKGHNRKDWYEISNDRKSLARRVELPTWLSEIARDFRFKGTTLLAELCANKISHPKTEIGESKGHILIEAQKYTKQSVPCVGVDTKVIDDLSAAHPEKIIFYVYFNQYTLGERWSVSWDDFIANRILVNPEKGFDPQYMIPTTYLNRQG